MRTKHVYKTNEVPKLWADGLPNGFEVRNARRNLYAVGDTIFSYGSHFPIAVRVVLPDQSIVSLITDRRYSNTTNRHRCRTYAAAFNVGSVFVLPPYLWSTVIDRSQAFNQIAEHYQRLINTEEVAASKPRIRMTTRQRHRDSIDGIYKVWVEIHRLFAPRIDVTEVFTPVRPA